ncbi:MAG: hypothetical protein ACO3NK_16500, partial [Prochlorotrichaceae cyanobacterium]
MFLSITSCTGEKRHKPDNQLTLKDFQDWVPQRVGRLGMLSRSRSWDTSFYLIMAGSKRPALKRFW